MSVNNIARGFQGLALYSIQAKNMTTSNTTAQNQSAQDQSTKIGEAFELDLSDAAKQATQKTTKQTTEDLSAEETTAKETKGLSADQINALNEDLAAQEQTMLNVMIQALTDSNNKLQGWLDEGIGILNFDGVQIDAARFALPEVATNAEDAAKAIAPGGAWSVEAVSSRIFELASAIAGDDPEKLSQMRAAVEKGFEQAGMTWKDSTGQSNLPDISTKTYDEIMSLFDRRTEELKGSNTVTE